MLRAVIDIGTNSVLLLIADLTSGFPEPVVDTSVISRLGHDLAKTGKILRPNLENTVEVIIDYLKICEEYQVSDVCMTGTEVFRRAENSEGAVEFIFERTGHPVSVISPGKEAELSFMSALSDTDEQKRCMVFDIGGGSTEFALGTVKKIESARSVPLGCVSLTAKHLKHDPPQQYEIDSLRQELSAEFGRLAGIPEGTSVYCVGGTVTTAVSLLLELDEWDAEKVDGVRLTPEHTALVLSRITEVGLHERMTMKGMEPRRADVIIAGIVILEQIMKRFGLPGVTVSTRGLRYSVALNPHNIV